ncbi:pyruvate dehydrogenase phosphatase regulatory subunit, mitochondrial isoform X4 [Ostrinia furnacalis]|uniref:pyruvate dehydrogenase phosphatase regulatory subunit, mitochondrial isoform X1 n=2 Tax=Ostrinia furnacalis TaxID=93504 RepID=UPI00103FE144|nr:pyruvate dehydrogenase phosphatase regulatory subunit, mitochondrial isoform X1 [Ostrinia furnacalis]XP_028166817.1 pyruvate dehydrogenase phosphatase regulatory subunit, mitochondrial isoform X2 [Ostrinia furnacalis]XP_028166818.1 pyruvate dehydrogenase phosphatase regulatory subunit, mitochondrial isoform X3 [Ostrinia furnacalis]XP_028166819.1 pyruvate dehydrogenase phosphatase regulatory subunit, mitochondrial isoform X4 [Ostrinia furnacalis]
MLVRRLRGGSRVLKVQNGICVAARNYSNRLDSLDNEERLEGCLSALPSKAKVVICGGGVMGAAVAYHLAKRGWGDQTLLIEKELAGGGSRWHSSGLVGMFKPSLAQVRLAQSSIRLLQELESRGRSTGWKQCGSLLLARTRDRMTVYRRMKSQSVSWGIPCELVTPKRCQEIWPMLNVDDILGGLWIPNDGVGDPHLFCMSLLKEAVENGVGVMENCSITKVLSKDDRVCGVETTAGAIECEYFVNCAGFWARQVGQLSNPQVKVPLLPCEHYYLHTKPIENLDPMTPVVRDPDGYIYLRERDGCILAGGFEPVAKPVYEEEITSASQRCVPEDWDHFHVLLQQLLKRVPGMSQAVLHRLCNGLEAFSPDCKWIVGEAPEMFNYHIAAGMKTVGISAAGGVAEATVDEIVDGYTKYDMYELDINRFLGLHNNKRFLRDRVKEVPGVHYGLPYPFPEFETGRNLRLSPIYPTLRDNGAVFGQVMGYERPTWFETVDTTSEPQSPRPFKIAYTKTFGKPHWFDTVQREYWACREAVGLADYSSFTKIDLQSKGREVVDLLQYLCSNDVDVAPGSIIHTGMQNERGGYENDCSLARISENHYMMIAPTIQQTRCKVWLKRHLPRDGSVTLSDVTSMYTAICVMGPFTRTLLSELTDVDLSPSNFPFFTFKELDVGLANGIRAMNLTHTGELGYVLYIPNEFALHVYNRLMTVGEKYGISHVGYYASRALRVEKFFAFWGQDLDTMTTPLECGRTWRVKFNKDIPFIGREALLKQRSEGVRRQYVQLLLTDHDHELDLWSWGGEPIYRDGNYCGQTTTTSYGFTFKKQVCLGFVQNIDKDGVAQKVTNDYVLGGHYEIDIAGIRYAAKVNLHSPNLPTKYPDKERDVYQATRKLHEPHQFLGRHYQP